MHLLVKDDFNILRGSNVAVYNFGMLSHIIIIIILYYLILFIVNLQLKFHEILFIFN